MFTIPYEKMICDTNQGDGGISFYEEYCEWINRYNGKSFKIYYKDNHSANGKDYIDYAYKGIESFLEDILKKEI